MAHFAKINESNIVEQVIVVDDNDCLDEFGTESEKVGIAFCNILMLGTWVQTSYTGKIRKNYARVGYVYDRTRDAFVPPRPSEFAILDEETCRWVFPKEVSE
jgi:hypothetical protein